MCLVFCEIPKYKSKQDLRSKMSLYCKFDLWYWTKSWQNTHMWSGWAVRFGACWYITRYFTCICVVSYSIENRGPESMGSPSESMQYPKCVTIHEKCSKNQLFHRPHRIMGCKYLWNLIEITVRKTISRDFHWFFIIWDWKINKKNVKLKG